MAGVGAHHPRPIALGQVHSVALRVPFAHEGNCKVRGVARLIDVRHLGRERVIGSYELDGLLIDPGPASSVAALEGLELRGLLLTHIHLDHAGATGVLVREHPDLTVYVHESGAPHLIDPSKLLRSAARLYGDDMDRLWGEVAPVPERNIRPLAGGEQIEGFRVAYTPGHASHHVCYLHEETGDAYVGDMGGVRIPPSDRTLAPTPPPDIDVEAWLASLETISGWEPQRLCLTHFGRADDPPAQLDRVREALRRQLEMVERSDQREFTEWLTADLPEETAECYIQAAVPDQLYMGLERYLSKRAEAATSA
ncbi:MAG: MBL fold metallo-hydrolase [Actinobacteria bacterium]|nr:MAG: MBL fold metallo-hydrolase [Actinomycetota bacterium]